jgi:hypothetical protein
MAEFIIIVQISLYATKLSGQAEAYQAVTVNRRPHIAGNLENRTDRMRGISRRVVEVRMKKRRPDFTPSG